MKIGPIDHHANAIPAAAERRSSPAVGATAAVEPDARVELSSKQALAGSAARSDFDQAKVDRIAQAIRDGQFKVDAEAIADKLLANARELLQRGAG